MKAWEVQNLGLPWDEMVLVDRPSPDCGADQVRIAVAAADLNFADILQCQGQYQVKVSPPFVPGMGAAGTVLEAGDDSGFNPGDKVVGPTVAGSGGYAQEALLFAPQATAVPDNIDLLQAAAMHVTYGTAWFALYHRGQLRAGETVLVLAAAGGVGSAAVDMAKQEGCWVVAAASAGKAQHCLDLGADEFVDYDDEHWYDRVMELTGGRGLDVVYDPVGGKYFDVARRLVAWEGRLLIVGFASGDIPSAAMNHALVKNYSLVGVHMGGYRQKDPKPFDECYRALYEMLAADKLHPLIDRIVGLEDLPDALRDLYERRSVGRLMLRPDAN